MHLLELKPKIMSEELNKEIAPEPVEEEIQEATVTATTREEIIVRLQEMVGDISLAKRPELESLKQNFYNCSALPRRSR